jgi:putative ABC transport system permease protein
MLENIGLSFQGIWAHKMRSFLTMLGIIIGIASIIAIVSTISGTNEQIKQNLIGSGNNAVDVVLYQEDWPFEMQYSSLPQGIPVLDEENLAAIEELEGVETAAFYRKRSTDNSVFHGSAALSGGYIYGTDNRYLDINGFLLAKGRTFSEEDLKNFKKVAILEENTAEMLFAGEDPIGKTIEIQREPFVVIGVVRKSSQFEPVINSIEDYYTYNMYQSSTAVFIPHTDWPILYQYDEPQSVQVKASSTDEMTSAGKNTADYLNAQVANETIQYKSSSLLEQAEQLQQVSNSTNTMLIWIASISLLVGGIGVMNIMLVSVTERTREIGLKKALGARKTRILGQFLTEAAVLTSLGGLLGVAAGIGLAEIVSRVAEIPIAINIPAAIVAVVFSMLIGLIFGILPSVKAANLNPIDALRHE